ncbi:MAG: truA [Gammaproteobacteria bacterium]|jgi:tRNA pseudouridine38-40 synthase|nr:truA [Gammaproteobacteria bacterium]
MRICLGVSYNGSQFHGWQRQTGLRTVQQELEKALSKIANAQVIVNCAGRTDAGVNASGQIVHFDSEVERDLLAWQIGTNRYLPPDIVVQWAKEALPNFHARFSAIARTYCYRIFNHSVRPIFNRESATWIPQPLDETVMQQAGQYLLGEHDFSSFRASECQSVSPMRNIHSLLVKRHENWVTIEITANAFLHHMVRNIVGVLLVIGKHKKPASWVKSVLTARDRTLAAATAPPQGLCLVKVLYPKEYDIPLPFSDKNF